LPPSESHTCLVEEMAISQVQTATTQGCIKFWHSAVLALLVSADSCVVA
jgi:hypothetical protein